MIGNPRPARRGSRAARCEMLTYTNSYRGRRTAPNATLRIQQYKDGVRVVEN